MTTIMKVVLIFIAMFFTAGIIVLLRGGSQHGTGGPIGIIALFAFMGGARAIWKYNPDKSSKNPNDKHELDKS